MSATGIAIDTPDYQRGVVSAQLLLAEVNSGVAHVIVGIPPNAETLVVVGSGLPQINAGVCIGQTTNVAYTGKSVPAQGVVTGNTTWLFDISAATDTSVEVSFSSAPTSKWYVYADSGVHLVVDPSTRTDQSGAQYVTSIPPSIFQGDHPLVELQYHGFSLTPPAAILAGPGVGVRYRVFGANMSIETAGGVTVLTDAVAGTGFLTCTGTGNIAQQFLPSGLALSSDAGIDMELAGAAALTVGVVVYTVETI